MIIGRLLDACDDGRSLAFPQPVDELDRDVLGVSHDSRVVGPVPSWARIGAVGEKGMTLELSSYCVVGTN